MNIKMDKPKSLYIMYVSGTLVFLYLVAIITLNQVYYLKGKNADNYLEKNSILNYNVTSQVWWGFTTLITFVIFVFSVISYIDTTKKQNKYHMLKSNNTKSKDE